LTTRTRKSIGAGLSWRDAAVEPGRQLHNLSTAAARLNTSIDPLAPAAAVQ
jgi:hypothetical protein